MEHRTVVIFSYVLDILDTCAITLALLVAFIIQFTFNELPCPLCLLQRLGVLAMAMGPIMNLRYGVKPAHYSMSILASVFTMVVALRQIALHVVPGTGSYGMALFGMHLYVWVFIFAVASIVYYTVVMAFATSWVSTTLKSRWFKYLSHFAFIILLLIIIANIIVVFLECGLGQCPDNPGHYMALWSL